MSQRLKKVIYIYNDEGVSRVGIENIKQNIKLYIQAMNYMLEEIDAQKVVQGAWKKSAAAFFMPGGADLMYCKKLNGPGNEQIMEYVKQGGSYIGFCAGAYYASSYCEFHKYDQRGYEVLGKRELAFFPGKAIGPVLGPYNYLDKLGSTVAEVKWLSQSAQFDKIYNVYFNGGCYFENANQYSHINVLGTYDNENFKNLAAIIECHVKKGKAVLSAVHPEYSVENLRKEEKAMSKQELEHLNLNIYPKLQDNTHETLFRLIIVRLLRIV